MISLLQPDTLLMKRRRLHKLEQQRARMGHNTPPEVAIEIEDLGSELASATAVPESEVERFVLLRDLILETRGDMRELHRYVRWLIILTPVLILLAMLVVKL